MFELVQKVPSWVLLTKKVSNLKLIFIYPLQRCRDSHQFGGTGAVMLYDTYAVPAPTLSVAIRC
jgi:hypothetical protein